MKKYSFTVEKTEDGYSAYGQPIPEAKIVTVGGSIEELKENLLDALNLSFEHHKKEHVTIESIVLVLN